MAGIEILAATNIQDQHYSYVGFRPPLSELQQKAIKTASFAFTNMPKQWDESSDYTIHSGQPLAREVLKDISEEAAFVLREAGYDSDVIAKIINVNTVPKLQESLFVIYDRLVKA